MLAAYISYILTFIISAGLAVFGILISFQLYQQHKTLIFSDLFYYQIFLFSFFIYAIWGNIALREMLSDIEMNPMLETKLAIFLPMLGLPFLLVSWFMLLRFVLTLNFYSFSGIKAFVFFTTFLLLIIWLATGIQTGRIQIPKDADLFIVRVLIITNLFFHILLFIPFIKPGKRKKENAPTIFSAKDWVFYLTGVLVYSVFTFYFDFMSYFSICISIILLFTFSVLIPVKIRFSNNNILEKPVKNIDFDSFCKLYEVSKREADIIREICSGKSNREISESLFITLQTVKDHTSRIYFKTGVNSRTQLLNLVHEKTGSKEK